MLALAGTAAVGALAGCTGGGSSSPDGHTVTAAKPDGDGSATPGELRWLLTHGDGALDVRGMRVDGDDIDVTFASDASDLTAFLQEIGKVLNGYARYVRSGGTATRLVGHVADRARTDYEGGGKRGQADRFHVKREWAQKFNDGALSKREYLQKAINTRAYVRTVAAGNATSTTSATTASTSGNATSGDA
ncbi:hypothetical protein MBEHAL_0064 [Halarchaeum acidiphilum MH1-52-1]|uniref:DUF8159 domain-containing protein n=1 Tax=Halarchaeum acidiphilum MH1-52-1 TaxID=1261545 RepID=U3A0Z5_9EURY|nr:hypothetical protein MBEHAL_0064 [Halarchaeum acidiphilum MH1-52-1]